MRQAPKKPLDADLRDDYFSELAEREAERKARLEQEEWEAGELDRELESIQDAQDDYIWDNYDYSDYDYFEDYSQDYQDAINPEWNWKVLIWRMPQETTAEHYRRLWAECGY